MALSDNQNLLISSLLNGGGALASGLGQASIASKDRKVAQQQMLQNLLLGQQAQAMTQSQLNPYAQLESGQNMAMRGDIMPNAQNFAANGDPSTGLVNFSGGMKIPAGGFSADTQQMFSPAARTGALDQFTQNTTMNNGALSQMAQQLAGASGLTQAPKGYEYDENGNLKQHHSLLGTIGKVALAAAPIALAPFTGGMSLGLQAALGAGMGAAQGAASGGGLKGALLGAAGGAIPTVGGAALGKIGGSAGQFLGSTAGRTLSQAGLGAAAGGVTGGAHGALQGAESGALAGYLQSRQPAPPRQVQNSQGQAPQLQAGFGQQSQSPLLELHAADNSVLNQPGMQFAFRSPGFDNSPGIPMGEAMLKAHPELGAAPAIKPTQNASVLGGIAKNFDPLTGTVNLAKSILQNAPNTLKKSLPQPSQTFNPGAMMNYPGY
jgi:hypothetical protein